jgi:2-polyprenyl-3-methyl-5-hydroxy-6-metoxy-1,4-benzoquinol methylase
MLIRDRRELMGPKNPDRSPELTFDDFKKLAQDESLSIHEKMGFPDSYREGQDESISTDILRKLPNLFKSGLTVVDIGPGCGGPAFRMIEWCRRHGHKLVLIDSQEMLNHLPSEPFIEKFAGKYPDQCEAVLRKYRGGADAIVCYSVLHYIFLETNLFSFLDESLSLLSDGGEMLIGDIPNVSKRKRFFSSPNGIRFHQNFTGTNEVPTVNFKSVEIGKIDDSVLISMVLRARNAGCDAYLVPQPDELSMANRREDLLIRKP